jgi:hypothetical protein
MNPVALLKSLSGATWLTARGLLLRGSKQGVPSRTFHPGLSSGDWLKRISEREMGFDVMSFLGYSLCG